jgi:hypothetical protein
MGKNGVTGIIVSIPSEVINRIFHHHEIYAMLARGDHQTDLTEGDRIFFYDAGGKGLEGEAIIEKISFQRAREVKLYGRDLYLSAEELDKYLADVNEDNEDAEMLVLKVEDATKYTKPLKCGLKIESRGVYMNKEIFAQVIRENQ